MVYQETFVQRNQHRIYVREYPGAEPTIILMHGFPDNLHLYDRLFLISRHRVESLPLIFSGGALRTNPPAILTPPPIKSVTWMPSSPNCGFSKSSSSRTTPLVHRRLTGPSPSPSACRAGVVEHLLLLNAELRPPEAIWLFRHPWSETSPGRCRRCLVIGSSVACISGRLGDSSETRRSEMILATAVSTVRCHAKRSSRLLSLERDLLPTIRSRTKMLPKLREFRRPVRIIFGDADPYLNTGVAQRFHELFPVSELFLVPGARHFVQMDEPAQVARLILAMPRTGNE